MEARGVSVGGGGPNLRGFVGKVCCQEYFVKPYKIL